MQIHIVRSDERRTIPKLVGNVEDDDYRCRQIKLEKCFGLSAWCHGTIVYRPCSNPDLRDEHEAVEDEANPATDDTRLAAEGKLLKRMPLLFPSSSESDMGETDAAPGED